MTETTHDGWPLTGTYGTSYRRRMDTFRDGLWKRLDTVPTLDPQTRDAVLQYLLELACQSQNIANISLGRMALLTLPRHWVLGTIERTAEALLDLEDEWEYRRLLELYQLLDRTLVHHLVALGLTSPNRAVRETAQERAESTR